MEAAAYRTGDKEALSKYVMEANMGALIDRLRGWRGMRTSVHSGISGYCGFLALVSSGQNRIAGNAGQRYGEGKPK